MDWHPGQSADELNPDEEVDLAKVGNPGGAEWAYVAKGTTAWTWGVLDRWLWDDATVLAEGTEASKDAAKEAVQRWVEGKEKS